MYLTNLTILRLIRRGGGRRYQSLWWLTMRHLPSPRGTSPIYPTRTKGRRSHPYHPWQSLVGKNESSKKTAMYDDHPRNEEEKKAKKEHQSIFDYLNFSRGFKTKSVRDMSGPYNPAPNKISQYAIKVKNCRDSCDLYKNWDDGLEKMTMDKCLHQLMTNGARSLLC